MLTFQRCQDIIQTGMSSSRYGRSFTLIYGGQTVQLRNVALAASRSEVIFDVFQTHFSHELPLPAIGDPNGFYQLVAHLNGEEITPTDSFDLGVQFESASFIEKQITNFQNLSAAITSIESFGGSTSECEHIAVAYLQGNESLSFYGLPFVNAQRIMRNAIDSGLDDERLMDILVSMYYEYGDLCDVFFDEIDWKSPRIAELAQLPGKAGVVASKQLEFDESARHMQVENDTLRVSLSAMQTENTRLETEIQEHVSARAAQASTLEELLDANARYLNRISELETENAQLVPQAPIPPVELPQQPAALPVVQLANDQRIGVFTNLFQSVGQNKKALADHVKVSASSTGCGVPESVLLPNGMWRSDAIPHSSLTATFVTGQFKISSYMLQTTRWGVGSDHLRSWELKGSPDGRQWIVLDSRQKTDDLNAPSARAVYTIDPPCQETFVAFMLESTGHDHNKKHYLALSHIELFGELA